MLEIRGGTERLQKKRAAGALAPSVSQKMADMSSGELLTGHKTYQNPRKKRKSSGVSDADAPTAGVSASGSNRPNKRQKLSKDDVSSISESFDDVDDREDSQQELLLEPSPTRASKEKAKESLKKGDKNISKRRSKKVKSTKSPSQTEVVAKAHQTLQMWRNLYEEIDRVDLPAEEYVPPKQKLPELTSLLELQDPDAAEIRERQIRKRAMRAAVQVVTSRNEGGKLFEELSEDTVREAALVAQEVMASGVIPEDVASQPTPRRRRSRSSISREESRDVTVEGVEPGHGGEEEVVDYQLPPIPTNLSEFSSNVKYKPMPTSPTIGGAVSRVPTQRHRAIPLSAPKETNAPLEKPKEVDIFRLANSHRGRAAALGKNS